MAVRRMSVAVVLAVLVTGCSSGHSGPTGHRLTAIAQQVTPAASPSSTATPLTVANAYAQVRQAASTYTALHGTVTVSESTPTQRFELHGSFATDLQDFGGAATTMALRTSNPAGTLDLRVLGSDVYDRSSDRPAWEKITKLFPTDSRQQGLRDLVGQLAGPLDPEAYGGMLSAAPDLKQLATGPGRSAFTGNVGLGGFNDPSQRFAPFLLAYYQRQGVKYTKFTVTLDAQARPVSLSEQVHSPTLTFDYQITFTGYGPTKVTAPI
jgi:hypothetical protein